MTDLRIRSDIFSRGNRLTDLRIRSNLHLSLWKEFLHFRHVCATSQPSKDIGGIWPLDASAVFTRYCGTFIEGYKDRAQTMPRRFARIDSDENERKAIAAGRVTPMDLRNYKDARTWITTGVPSLLVWSCFACTQGISD